MSLHNVLNIQIPDYNMKCIKCKTKCPLTHKISSNVNYYICFTPFTMIYDCMCIPYTIYKEVVIREQIVDASLEEKLNSF